MQDRQEAILNEQDKQHAGGWVAMLGGLIVAFGVVLWMVLELMPYV